MESGFARLTFANMEGKNMRKMLSLLLALLMTVTVVPVEAFAADPPLPLTLQTTVNSRI